MPRGDVCGALDVGDVRGFISSDSVPRSEILLTLTRACASPLFDGPAPPEGRDELIGAVVLGRRVVAKAQRREHERHETAIWFEGLRRDAGIPAPALLDDGAVDLAAATRWWLILERAHGGEARQPTAPRLRALGSQLRVWHELAPPSGLRLDDPGALGVLLGTPRGARPDTYLAASEALAGVCQGQPMTAIHGDVAVGHNTLFRESHLAAILDPGAVHVGPPMIDLAWCLAIDLPRGAEPAPLLDGYGRDAVDRDALEALLPQMLLRRLIDSMIAGNRNDTRWLVDALGRRAPGLLDLAGVSARER